MLVAQRPLFELEHGTILAVVAFLTAVYSTGQVLTFLLLKGK